MYLLGGWLAMGHGFHRGMLDDLRIFALITAIGFDLGQRKTIVAVSSSILAASIAFFVLANFGVWAEGAIYPYTMDGLWAALSSRHCRSRSGRCLGTRFMRSFFSAGLLFSNRRCLLSFFVQRAPAADRPEQPPTISLRRAAIQAGPIICRHLVQVDRVLRSRKLIILWLHSVSVAPPSHSTSSFPFTASFSPETCPRHRGPPLCLQRRRCHFPMAPKPR